MKRKIASIFLVALLLISLSINNHTQAEETVAEIDDIEEIEEGFIPVVDSPDDKNDFEINPNLPVEFEPEYELEYELPDLEENQISEKLKEQVEEADEKIALIEKYQTHPLTQVKMLSVLIPRFFTPIHAQTFSGPSIGGFSNIDENYNIYSASKGGRKLTYVNAKRSYNPDAAVLDYADGRYRIVIAGVDGWIDEEAIIYFPMNEFQSLSHYYVDAKGDLIHALTKGPHAKSYTTINNGPAPNYLKRNVHYYSYDGHYFYTNIQTMLNDYKNNTRNHALNATQPFFNYFQFLSYRTKTSINAKDIDNYLSSKGYTQQVEDKYKDVDTYQVPSNQSKLVGESHHFIDQMNRFGANGAMTFAVAVHESGWGRSPLARNRNNLFGHKAYDKYPGAADSYGNVADAIHSHNTRFINWHYLDYTDENDHYQGGMLGNKLSGINVHYASDAYWGEKIAAHYLQLDRATGNKDYGKYKLGFKNDDQKVNLRKEPNTNSSVVLSMKAKHQTFVIYEAVKGEEIKGNDIWYKISSDHILTKDRDRYDWVDNATSRGVGYLLDQSYVYVHSSFVTQVGKTMSVKPIKKGDVNGDGKITVIDLAMVQSHMLNKNKLTGDSYYSADINGDGKISVIDLAMIQSHMLGINKIEG